MPCWLKQYETALGFLNFSLAASILDLPGVFGVCLLSGLFLSLSYVRIVMRKTAESSARAIS